MPKTHSALKYDEVTCYVGTVAKESTACSNHNPNKQAKCRSFSAECRKRPPGDEIGLSRLAGTKDHVVQ